MSTARIFKCLVLVFILNTCNGATLHAIGNNTGDSTALAKTSITDVFEDIRWFFDRFTTFCDVVQKMLPPERKEREHSPASVSITVQNGLRHFTFGAREISRSIVRVLSDKDVQEYKQLSRATDYAQDMVTSVGDFFRNLRILVSDGFVTYTYYVPEMVLTKCLGTYLLRTYPDRHVYEFPILLIRDVVDAFRTPIGFEDDMSNNTTDSGRKLDLRSEIHFDKDVEQNEILDEDMYVFHNTPISPSPELLVKTEEVVSNNDDSLGYLGVNEIAEEAPAPPSWKMCVQKYATETIFRKLELYLMPPN